MEIKDIKIRELSIPEIPDYLTQIPQSIPIAPPVTVQLGFPIVDLPGCVESNKEKNSKNTSLLKDDPNGTITLCDGTVPSFNPIEFTPEEYLITPKSTLPPVKPPKNDAKLPQVQAPIIRPEIEIPQISTEEKEVILEEESINIIDYLPPVEAVVSTAVIASAAATSALVARPLANLLLKLIRPVAKKIIKKISDKFSKHEEIWSVAERREWQREKNEGIKALRKIRGRR